MSTLALGVYWKVLSHTVIGIKKRWIKITLRKIRKNVNSIKLTRFAKLSQQCHESRFTAADALLIWKAAIMWLCGVLMPKLFYSCICMKVLTAKQVNYQYKKDFASVAEFMVQ